MQTTINEKALYLQHRLAALEEPQDLLFAVDGSGSVRDDQFDTMKFAIRTLLNYFNMDGDPHNPNYRVGAVSSRDNSRYIY
jgi:hypothetical protein